MYESPRFLFQLSSPKGMKINYSWNKKNAHNNKLGRFELLIKLV